MEKYKYGDRDVDHHYRYHDREAPANSDDTVVDAADLYEEASAFDGLPTSDSPLPNIDSFICLMKTARNDVHAS